MRWNRPGRHRSGFVLINLESCLDGLEVCIVEPVFAQRSGLKPLDHDVEVATVKVEDASDVDSFLEQLSLVDVSRNAIEQHGIRAGIELAVADAVVHVVSPQLDRRFVRHEVAVRGVVEEQLAKRVLDAQIPKQITAGNVEVVWDSAENLTLRALAGTG